MYIKSVRLQRQIEARDIQLYPPKHAKPYLIRESDEGIVRLTMADAVAR